MFMKYDLSTIDINSSLSKFGDLHDTIERLLIMCQPSIEKRNVYVNVINSCYDKPMISSEIKIDKLNIDELMTKQDFWMCVTIMCYMFNQLRQEVCVVNSQTRDYILNMFKMIYSKIGQRDGKQFVKELTSVIQKFEISINNYNVLFMKQRNSPESKRNGIIVLHMIQQPSYWRAAIFVMTVLSAITEPKK